MLNDKSLEDRLNAVKYGQEIPEPPINPSDFTWGPQVPFKNTLIQEILIDLCLTSAKFLGFLIVSILYGLAFQAIFLGFAVISKDTWNIWQILGLGFLFNYSITVFTSMIMKLFFGKKL